MWWNGLRRRWLLRKAPPGPLRDYLQAGFPRAGTGFDRAPLLAVDLEMTGLDPQQDDIVSIGWVPIDGGGIRLAGARRILVRPGHDMTPASAVIHKITDTQAEAGVPLAAALAELLAALRGRVMVAHHARIELRFIDAACRRVFGNGIVIPAIDTEWLARRRFERRNQAFKPKDLGLANVRSRYNLPIHQAHDALGDAIATAELFLAQVSDYGAGRSVPLAHILY
ncbi:MAG TPA: 3'-5' exonuclease, partial [Thioalkalivibrio sp.]|nr:3'-5' exonuclease [Thioalkalivibrio sp.]